MKTNKLRCIRVSTLFFLTALLLFPLISGAQVKVVSTSGNVGVGTTSPGASTKLQVSGNGLFTGGSQDPGDGTPAGVRVGYSASDYGFIQSMQTGVAYKTLSLQPNGGNVGIGTTGPVQKFVVTDLNVITNSAGNSTVVTSDAAAANKGGSLTLGGLYTGGGSVPAPFAGIAGRYTSGTSGYMALSTLNSGAMAEWMRITSVGNVGIGTTSPLSALHIDNATGLSLDVATQAYSAPLKYLENHVLRGRLLTIAGDLNYESYNSSGTFLRTDVTISNSTGNVGIGTTTPLYKLDVLNTTSGGIAVRGTSTATSESCYGGFFESKGSGAAANVGLYAAASAGTVNYNLYLSSLSTGANNYSLYSAAAAKSYINGDVGIGTTTPGLKLHVVSNANTFRLQGSDHTFMEFYPDGAATRRAYFGFAAETDNNLTIANEFSGSHIILLPTGTGSVGIGTTTPGTYKLYVNGTSYFNGNGTYNGTWLASDQQLKTNIDSLNNALSIINQLKPSSYFFDTTNVYGMNFSNQKQYGLIAQDVEQLLPELISNTTKPATYDTAGVLLTPALTYKVLNYNAFTAIMLQGIKEQSSKIDSLSEGLLTEKTKTNIQDSIISSLQNQMNVLASTINSCCNDNHDNGNHNEHHKADNNQTNVELNDAQTIVLEQNVPNPFAEQTAINYSLPDNTVKAQMLFYNAQGKLIQSTDLTQKGKGTLNVFASDLSSGIYTYTLVVDGKIIETRKMVKQ